MSSLQTITGDNLQDLLDALPCLIGFFDETQTLRQINQKYSDWYGVAAQAFLGKTLRELWGEALYSQQKIYVENVLSGQEQKFAGSAFHPLFGMCDTENSLVPHRTMSGSVDGFFLLIHDLTSTGNHPNLTNEEARFREIANEAPVHIWITGQSGIQYVNKTYTIYTGKKLEQLMNMKWISHVHPEDRDAFIQRYNEFFQRQDLFSFVYRFRREDNIYRWFNAICKPRFDSNGSFAGFISTSMDITCVKNLSNELKEAKERAEKADRAKMEFLANMSHEIRTPMNAVIGIANLLDKTETNNDLRRKFMKTLKSSAQQLMDLINDILDVAKIQSGALVLESLPFDLKAVIGDVTDIFSFRAQEKGIALKSVYKNDGEHKFLGDPLRLKQVVVNLVGNALKFTEKGGITIEVEILNKEGRKALIEIRVQDTGIGIEQEKLEIIFDKFTQVDNSVSRQYGGSGLGLTISKTLVELMNGFMHVESRPGKGSCFSIQIPLEILVQHNTDSSDASLKNPAITARKILLVEDNEANILVAKTILEDYGCEVNTARSGEAAISMLRKNRYDLVLMDVQMPGMDGQNTVRLWREEEKKEGFPRTKIIAMTANVLKGDKELCLAAGMDDYLSKPFSIEALQQKLAA